MTYYNAFEEYGEKYFQLPKVFFTSPVYKDALSNTDKIAYGMLKDRLSLSIKNGWHDKNGNVYFVFSNAELEEILSCSKNTVTAIRKSLVKAKLLEIKRNGQGMADWLYLKRPQVTEADIYLINKAESVGAVGNPKSCDSEKTPQTLAAVGNPKSCDSRIPKNTPQESQKIRPNKTELNNTELSNTEISKPLSHESENYIYNLGLPMPLRKFLYENREKGKEIQFDLNALELFYNTDRNIKPNADKDDMEFLNDYDVLYMVKTIFWKMDKPVKNTNGLLYKWTLDRLSFKRENILNERSYL